MTPQPEGHTSGWGSTGPTHSRRRDTKPRTTPAARQPKPSWGHVTGQASRVITHTTTEADRVVSEVLAGLGQAALQPQQAAAASSPAASSPAATAAAAAAPPKQQTAAEAEKPQPQQVAPAAAQQEGSDSDSSTSSSEEAEEEKEEEGETQDQQQQEEEQSVQQWSAQEWEEWKATKVYWRVTSDHFQGGRWLDATWLSEECQCQELDELREYINDRREERDADVENLRDAISARDAEIDAWKEYGKKMAELMAEYAPHAPKPQAPKPA